MEAAAADSSVHSAAAQPPPVTPTSGPSPSWADAAKFSAAQAEGAAESEPTPPTPAGAESAPEAPKLDEARCLDVLRAIGKPTDLDALRAEINANAALADHVPGGVVQATVDALIAADKLAKTEEGTPVHPHYVLAPDVAAETEEPKADEETIPLDAFVAARAAVVATLGVGLVYGAGGYQGGPPEPPPGGGFDVFQIAYVVHVTSEVTAAPIALFPEGVSVLVQGLDRNDMGGLEERIVGHLQPLVDKGVVDARVIPSVKAEEATDGAAETDNGTLTLYALSDHGRALFQARGALGVAQSTLPAPSKGPSVEEQVAAAVAPVQAELRTTIGEFNACIITRDTALHKLTKAEDLLGKYRTWFFKHDIDQPDSVVDVRRPAEHKVIKEYALDLVLTDEQHWRIIEERRLAKVALTELEAANAESKETWKGKLALAKGLVDRLETLSEFRPGTRHVIVKAVYKEMGQRCVNVFSAEEHDYGTLVTTEPIIPGSQRTIPNTIAEVPAVPPKATTVALSDIEPGKLGTALAEKMGGTASVKDGVAVVTINVDDKKAAAAPTLPEPAAEIAPDSDAGKVLTVLKKANADADHIAKKTKLDLPRVIAALATLGSRVEKSGSFWSVVKAPEEVVDATLPKGDDSKSLAIPMVKAGLITMFTSLPIARTGIYKGHLPDHYLKLIGAKLSASTRKVVEIAGDALIKAGTLATGEGGHDTLLWHSSLPDPRATGDDRDAAKAATSGFSAPVLAATGPGAGTEEDGGKSDDEEAPAAPKTPAKKGARGKAAAKEPKAAAPAKKADKGRRGKARA